jgi:hypothetical protein
VGRPTAPRVDAAERDARALELRADGLSFRQIGQQLGCSSTTAFRRVERGLDRTLREPADRVRALELHRLDQALAHTVAVLRARHVVIQGGRAVLDPTTGQPYPDHGPALAAIDRLLRISESRRRLLGLDAPARLDAQLRGDVYAPAAIDEELARLNAELAALGPPDPPPAEQLGPATPATPAPAAVHDVGGLVAGALDVALDAAGIPAGPRREAAYAAAAHLLQLREGAGPP